MKSAREKKLNINKEQDLTSKFSIKYHGCWRQWEGTFKVLQVNNYQLRIQKLLKLILNTKKKLKLSQINKNRKNLSLADLIKRNYTTGNPSGWNERTIDSPWFHIKKLWALEKVTSSVDTKDNMDVYLWLFSPMWFKTRLHKEKNYKYVTTGIQYKKI